MPKGHPPQLGRGQLVWEVPTEEEARLQAVFGGRGRGRGRCRCLPKKKHGFSGLRWSGSWSLPVPSHYGLSSLTVLPVSSHYGLSSLTALPVSSHYGLSSLLLQFIVSCGGLLPWAALLSLSSGAFSTPVLSFGGLCPCLLFSSHKRSRCPCLLFSSHKGQRLSSALLLLLQRLFHSSALLRNCSGSSVLIGVGRTV